MFKKATKNFVVAIVGLSILGFFIYGEVKEANREIGYRDHIVSSGDTLWTLCGEGLEEGDVRRLIYETKLENNMQQSNLEVGTHIRVAYFKD